MANLTPKQEKFVDYYIETGNATEAAIRAGYSQKTARSVGAENLTKPYIKEYIEKRNKELEDTRIADMKEVKQFWTTILRDGFVEPKDRLKASEYLAKTNGAFLDKIEHSGGVNNQIDLSGLTAEELRKLAKSDD